MNFDSVKTIYFSKSLVEKFTMNITIQLKPVGANKHNDHVYHVRYDFRF